MKEYNIFVIWDDQPIYCLQFLLFSSYTKQLLIIQQMIIPRCCVVTVLICHQLSQIENCHACALNMKIRSLQWLLIIWNKVIWGLSDWLMKFPYTSSWHLQILYQGSYSQKNVLDTKKDRLLLQYKHNYGYSQRVLQCTQRFWID